MGRTPLFSFPLDPELKADLVAASKREGCSLAEFVRRAAVERAGLGTEAGLGPEAESAPPAVAPSGRPSPAPSTGFRGPDFKKGAAR